jgi:hypothetical protein
VGLRPSTTPRSRGTTSPVGSRSPPSGGRSTRRGSCGATRWWHTRHCGDAGGVRWPRGQLTARTVGAVPWERWAGRIVVAPSWSSCGPRASGTPVGAECGSDGVRIVVRVPSSMRAIIIGSGSEVSRAGPVSSTGGRMRLRGGGPSGPFAARIDAGMPSIMPVAGWGASDCCAVGAGATRAEIGLSSTRWAATTPPTSRRVVARWPGSSPPSRLSTRAGPAIRTCPEPRDRVVEAPEVKSTTASPGGSPSKAFSTIARTRSTTPAPDGAVMDSTSQTSWTTCSSSGSVSSTQWAPLPISTPAPLVYRASTINVGSPRTRPHHHHHPSHQSVHVVGDLSESPLPTYPPCG